MRHGEPPAVDAGALTLEDARLAVRVMPLLGGKVVSVVHRASGREWLDLPPAGALAEATPGAAFDARPPAGLDECLPTVAACTLDGKRYADHGGAWSRPWSVVEHAADRLVMEVALDDPPLVLRRGLRLDSGTLAMDYTLTNGGGSPVPYVWAQHPLLGLHDGDTLTLWPDARIKRVEAALGAPEAIARDGAGWPGPCPGVRLDRLNLGPDPAYLKAFLPCPDGAAAAVTGAAGERLTCTFGPTEVLPWLGLWVTRGGFHGRHHFALEPTNAPHDALADAAAPPADLPAATLPADLPAATLPADLPAATLPAGATRRWWVRWAFA